MLIVYATNPLGVSRHGRAGLLLSRFSRHHKLFATTGKTSEASIANELTNWIGLTSSKTCSDQAQKTLNSLMYALSKDQRPPQELTIKIVDASVLAHRQLPNVIQVNRSASTDTAVGIPKYTRNLTIVGDTHGQYEDFVNIFQDPKIGGNPSEHNTYIFNGDIVDRGPKGVEILLVLLFAKLVWPSAVHILRGNHESRIATHYFGFENEVLRKYDWKLYDKFIALFEALPVAAVVANEVFVTHGGLGANTAYATIDEINRKDRFGVHCPTLYELLWADPDPTIVGTQTGPRPRFGADVTKAFLTKNHLKHMVRSHQLQIGGYSTTHDGLCTTVFSAPNYCGRDGNLGAVLRYDQPDSMKPTMITFQAASQRVSNCHE